jgi:hypothetical protein
LMRWQAPLAEPWSELFRPVTMINAIEPVLSIPDRFLGRDRTA